MSSQLFKSIPSIATQTNTPNPANAAAAAAAC